MKPDHSASPLIPDNERRATCASVRRKRREKMLAASEMRLLILHFLAQGPAHGYELIKAIEDLSKGEYTPSPGIIYPNLTLLEETGCIRVQDVGDKRKAYVAARKGTILLQENQERVTNIINRLTSLTTLVNNRRLPEVERAIHNMKSALNTRLSQANISTSALHAIIDALDEAAKKIKRS
ncbi:MAG: PadR family transcriptional regulator [Sodalis sp. (in: enterobacteria)]|uniref:PadR family transcriptional regulator n=1 Tax=Sodalis sp. (in: enterobacteria) TaxID=1898979 RepID=UPI0039E34D12